MAATSRRVLSTPRIVFLVIAAAAPMGAVVGNLPLALLRGNGVGLPASFLLATAVLWCFSVGYAAMSKRVVTTGAFYSFIARGMGRTAGVIAAYLGVLAYPALSCGLLASFGYFVRLVLLSSGVDLPWEVCSAVGFAVVAALGYRSVALSAKVLAVLLVLEFAVLLLFDALVGVHHGTSALPASSWHPSAVLTPTIGLGLMFAFVSFTGFESAALYGEEAHDPERSIPRAMTASVLLIGAFYVLTAWCVVGAGGARLAHTLPSSELGNLVFDQLRNEGGVALYDVAAVLLCTSVLASLLAVHNAASRYAFALGHERLLPSPLARYHGEHLSPHVASIAISGVELVVVGCFAVAGADPYLTAATSLVGVGTLGILLLQAGACAAVVAFFHSRRDRHWWRGMVAPGIGSLGLLTALVLAATSFRTLTGSTTSWSALLPLAVLLPVAVGLVVSRRLRLHRPAVWDAVAFAPLRPRGAVPRPPIDYTRRYCVVGAGPAGLVMARALLAEGVPFDWFERHSDVGGIWDMESPGSPMYDSAHFISSRYTSGFYGFPMGEELPDYPTWRQIRDYLREFACRFGLYDAVTLGVAVEEATPLAGNRWSVRLSTGEIREYDGLIAAPGVTWHPQAPRLVGEEDFSGTVRHAVTFRDGLELRGKRVLVVGAGNSGVDIASDAARHADRAYLSVRRGYRFVPKHLFGVPTDALLSGLVDPPKGVSLAGDPQQLVDALVGDLTRFGLPAPDHDLLTSHPVMNTQVLHHLAHGDLIAKPDVERLTPTGVRFVDGSEVEIDTVLLATGYRYLLPFLDPGLLSWKSGHPQLWLNVFSREHDSLYVLGFIEFADAAYKRFDEMASLIVLDLRARETGERDAEWRALKAADEPDLTGGVRYLDTPRHANYVNSGAYQRYLAELRDRFDWPTVDDSSYVPLPVPAGDPGVLSGAAAAGVAAGPR